MLFFGRRFEVGGSFRNWIERRGRAQETTEHSERLMDLHLFGQEQDLSDLKMRALLAIDLAVLPRSIREKRASK